MHKRIGIAGLCTAVLVVGLALFSACKPAETVVDIDDIEKIQDTAKFKQGVAVHGVDIGNMTFGDAKAAVEKAVAKDIDAVSYRYADGDVAGALTKAELGLTANVDEVLLEALNNGPPKKDEPGYTVKLSVSNDSFMRAMDALSEQYDILAQEPSAKGELSDKHKPEFTYHEGVAGRVLDKEALLASVSSKLDLGVFQAEIVLPSQPIQPEKDLAWIKANTQFRSKFTTRYKYSSSDQILKNRCFNVEKGADLLSGCIMQPGEEFSFNGYVGLRTEAAGWKLANGISGGKEYTLQAGGGICQVSTTLYNALLCGNIEIVYRKAHSIPSDYVPKGLDATVDSSGIDLKFLNNTGAPLYIFAYYTKDKESSRYRYLTVELYGEPLPEGVEYKTRSEIEENIIREAPILKDDPTIPIGYQITTVIKHDGYVATAYVDEYKDGKLVKSVSIGTNRYRGNEEEISVGTGDPATVPVPPGAVLRPGFEPLVTETPAPDQPTATPDPLMPMPDQPTPTPEQPQEQAQ